MGVASLARDARACESGVAGGLVGGSLQESTDMAMVVMLGLVPDNGVASVVAKLKCLKEKPLAGDEDGGKSQS